MCGVIYPGSSNFYPGAQKKLKLLSRCSKKNHIGNNPLFSTKCSVCPRKGVQNVHRGFHIPTFYWWSCATRYHIYTIIPSIHMLCSLMITKISSTSCLSLTFVAFIWKAYNISKKLFYSTLFLAYHLFQTFYSILTNLFNYLLVIIIGTRFSFILLV